MITLRIGAACAALVLWMISVQFSVAGFDITLSGYTWVGWALAFSVTILQLIFNRGIGNNPTLFVAGLLAYAYGITTNIIGIMRVQESIDDFINNMISDPISYVPGFVFAVILSLVIEVVPEALLLWAWFTENEELGDFISSIARGTRVSNPRKNQKPQNQRQR